MRNARSGLFALIFIGICWGCTPPATPPVLPDPVNWEGELRLLPGDSTFMPCGARRALRITGPGLDSLSRRYSWLRMVPGQWIKTWCQGYLRAGEGGKRDSVLVATAYQHMDPDVFCPPVPVDSLSGTYTAQIPMPGGVRSEDLVFLPGGDATIYTQVNGRETETYGRWGLDSGGNVVFAEENGRFMLLFVHGSGRLTRQLPSGRMGPVHVWSGPAERLRGTFGRTVRWLDAVATANGGTLHAEEVRPAMSLDSIFQGPARAALDTSAKDSLNLDGPDLHGKWAAVSTVRDVVHLVRSRPRPNR